MPLGIWDKLNLAFPRVPAAWEFADGEETDGPYVHRSPVIAMGFSPDDSLLAVAGGGCIPGSDPTIRLVDPITLKNVRTLVGHCCGLLDFSFDPETGFLASASFDYSVLLWNLDQEDIIFLEGEQGKVKNYSQFTRTGSLLATGETDYYDGDLSFRVHDLRKPHAPFHQFLPDGQGVYGLSASPSSRQIAFAMGDQMHVRPSRLRVFNTRNRRIVADHAMNGWGFYKIAFAGDETILAWMCGGEFGNLDKGEFDSGLALMDVASGNVQVREKLERISDFAVQPSQHHVAVALETEIRFYDLSNWTQRSSYTLDTSNKEHFISKVAFAHSGDQLAYGTTAGSIGIIRFDR